MTRNAAPTRLPWQDRWQQPSLDQLLKPLKATPRRTIENLMNGLDGFDRVESSIRWYGVSWKWTIEYRLTGLPKGADGSLCFIVPTLESPQVCIPIAEELMGALPRRLNRFIRDGLKAAKCAITIHWATWSPLTKAEVHELIDLADRKRAWLRGEEDEN